jgi:Trk K+ transport system NAD-binding subunit
MIFFETVLPYPEQWYLQILFFLIPILGLAAVADGVLTFGGALLNKKKRGQEWEVAMASTYSKHIIVCGLGKVGYRVCMELVKAGRAVVGVEANADNHFVGHVREMGIPVIVGDARHPETLEKACVQHADAIIPCTDNELANLDIALDARELKADIKIVMRMFDADLARRIEKGFGIQTAFSTSAIAAPIFAAAAMSVDVKYAFYVGETLLNMSEVVIGPGSRVLGSTVGQLETEFDVTVLRYQHGSDADLHPRDEYVLGAGDKLLVLAALDVLQRVNEAARVR